MSGKRVKPQPVTIVLDAKLVGMLEAWAEIDRELEKQKTATGKKKWTVIQHASTLSFLEDEAKPKIAERVRALFDAHRANAS